jgi:hypothetical protein
LKTAGSGNFLAKNQIVIAANLSNLPATIPVSVQSQLFVKISYHIDTSIAPLIFAENVCYDD